MSEIFNLSSLCRCCHADGVFKNIFSTYLDGNEAENYCIMLRDSFGVCIGPSRTSVSSTICDQCINQLRSAFRFKKQVLRCEDKLQEYIKNEQFLNNSTGNIKIEDVSYSDNSDDKDDIHLQQDIHDAKKTTDEKQNISNIEPEDNVNNRKRKSEATSTKSKPSTTVGSLQFCEICKTAYKGKYCLHRHVAPKHVKQLHKCSYCEKILVNSTLLKEHENSHTREIIYECDVCEKKFVYKQSLRKHISWHMGRRKRIICEICGLACNDRTNLEKHVMVVHEKLKPYKCEFCPKKYGAKKHLTEHVRKHTGERPYACDLCSKTFINSTGRKQHRLLHSRSDENRYLCKICNKTFSERGAYRTHLYVHDGEKPYKCAQCDKDFCKAFTLKRHIAQLHNGCKQFSCLICQKLFSQKGVLKRHLINIHRPTIEIEKRKCQVCKTNVRDLEKHSHIHKDRPFDCNFCNKTYPTKSAFNFHMKSHDGRTFSCELCCKCYRSSWKLKEHVSKHHTGVGADSVLDRAFDIPTYVIKKKRRKRILQKTNYDP